VNAGLLPLAIAAIGAAYGWLVIHAAPTRRDNVMFGLLAMTDAAMTAWRGVNVLAGDSIVSTAVVGPCALMTIALALISLDFMASFPRRRSMHAYLRAGLIAWGALGAALVLLVDRGHDHASSVSEWVFFAPATALIFVLGLRAWRFAGERAERTVIVVLLFRWVFGFSTYFVGPALGVFEQAVWLETTVATLVSFVVIGTAVLRAELFSIRSAAAEATVVAAIALVVALGGGAAVLAVLHWTEPGNFQTALLVGTSLLPVGLASAGRALYPRLEANVLAPLDERRARRLGVQGEPLPAEPSAAIAEASARITAISDGARTSWRTPAQIDDRLAATLRTGEAVRADIDANGSICPIGLATPPPAFVVPALGADRELVGAFAIEGGLVDRDTYVVARDLAARVALAVERAQAVTALEDARRLAALGQFAAAIAHDIRTPLTSISLNVQILRSKLQLSADDSEHLDIALEELARLDKSVAEILDFAKPVRLAPQALDLGQLIESTAHTLEPVLSERGVALRCEPDAALPAVQGDPQRLRQVLVNLVGNAAEASQPGGAVTVRAKPAADARIAIEVEDRGRGISPDDLPRIFEPFFTTRADGTGLGLAICRKVVRAHGGDIEVRSIVGEGSTFTVLLPSSLSLSAPPPDNASRNPA
jgi:signal transduction histidine kinase